MPSCYGIYSRQNVKRITRHVVSPCVQSLLLQFILLLPIHRRPVKPTCSPTHTLLGTINSGAPDNDGSCCNRSTKESLKGETGWKAQIPLTHRNMRQFIQTQITTAALRKPRAHPEQNRTVKTQLNDFHSIRQTLEVLDIY